MRSLVLTSLFLLLSTIDLHADDKSLADKVKSTWRSQTGESAEQIFAETSKVAHFVPRGWEAGQKTDEGDAVFFSWAKHRADKSVNFLRMSGHL